MRAGWQVGTRIKLAVTVSEAAGTSARRRARGAPLPALRVGVGSGCSQRWEDLTCQGEGRGALRTAAEVFLVPGTVQGALGLEESSEVCGELRFAQGAPGYTASSGKVRPTRQTRVLCDAAGLSPWV